MPIETVTAAAKLESARAAHAAAIAAHGEASAKASRTAERHREVAGQRQAMLQRIAAGEELDATDLARARDALAEAADVAAIHHAAWHGTQQAVHLAEIVMAHAAVAEFDARKAAVGAEAYAAFQEVDAAMDDVRAALVRGQAHLIGCVSSRRRQNGMPCRTCPICSAAIQFWPRGTQASIPKCRLRILPGWTSPCF